MTATVTTENELPGDTALRADSLRKQYRSVFGNRTNEALADCSLHLPAGKIAALIGANGAGKTTLLSILAGLLQPDAGTTHTSGRTAFVSQEKAVYKHLTPPAVLGIAARLNQVWDEDNARRWLERFDVPLERNCGKLSGGQQAQVAFAAALGSRPDVLLLDEPLSNLDPLVRREVMAELLTEVADTGMTVVLSTHVVAELVGVTDHLLLLAQGQLALAGDMDELLEQHVHYIGPPSEQPPGPGTVIEERHHGGQSTFLVRLPEHGESSTPTGSWVQRPATLEDLVLAQLAANRKGAQG